MIKSQYSIYIHHPLKIITCTPTHLCSYLISQSSCSTENRQRFFFFQQSRLVDFCVIVGSVLWNAFLFNTVAILKFWIITFISLHFPLTCIMHTVFSPSSFFFCRNLLPVYEILSVTKHIAIVKATEITFPPICFICYIMTCYLIW